MISGAEAIVGEACIQLKHPHGAKAQHAPAMASCCHYGLFFTGLGLDAVSKLAVHSSQFGVGEHGVFAGDIVPKTLKLCLQLGQDGSTPTAEERSHPCPASPAPRAVRAASRCSDRRDARGPGRR